METTPDKHLRRPENTLVGTEPLSVDTTRGIFVDEFLVIAAP